MTEIKPFYFRYESKTNWGTPEDITNVEVTSTQDGFVISVWENYEDCDWYTDPNKKRILDTVTVSYKNKLSQLSIITKGHIDIEPFISQLQNKLAVYGIDI